MIIDINTPPVYTTADQVPYGAIFELKSNGKKYLRLRPNAVFDADSANPNIVVITCVDLADGDADRIRGNGQVRILGEAKISLA